MTEYFIELNHLHFVAYHGLYEQEKINGGEFVVDLKAGIKVGNEKIDQLSQTADYEVLYEIIRKVMAEPKDLLETVAGEIIEKIHERFVNILSIEIKITKKKPPIPDFKGEAAVRLVRIY